MPPKRDGRAAEHAHEVEAVLVPVLALRRDEQHDRVAVLAEHLGHAVTSSVCP